MPTGGAVSPDGKHLAVVCSGGKDWSLSDKGNQSVRIIDTATEAIVKTLEEQEVFLGAALLAGWEKSCMFPVGLSDNVFVYDVEKDYSKLRTLDVPGYPFGLAVTHDGKSLLVASSHRSQVFQIDTETYEIVRKFEALTYPYLIEIDDADAFAYVTNIASNAVTILDLKQGTTAGHVSVGKNPEGTGFIRRQTVCGEQRRRHAVGDRREHEAGRSDDSATRRRKAILRDVFRWTCSLRPTTNGCMLRWLQTTPSWRWTPKPMKTLGKSPRRSIPPPWKRPTASCTSSTPKEQDWGRTREKRTPPSPRKRWMWMEVRWGCFTAA